MIHRDVNFMIRGPHDYYQYVPEKPPGKLTHLEYEWYLQDFYHNWQGYESQTSMMELMVVYDMIEKECHQGIVMSTWIKESFEKSGKVFTPLRDMERKALVNCKAQTQEKCADESVAIKDGKFKSKK